MSVQIQDVHQVHPNRGQQVRIPFERGAIISKPSVKKRQDQIGPIFSAIQMYVYLQIDRETGKSGETGETSDRGETRGTEENFRNNADDHLTIDLK